MLETSSPVRKTFLGNLSRYLDRFGSDLATFSFHVYPTSHCAGRNSSVEALLSDASVAGIMDNLRPLINATAAHSIPFWIGEGNSVSCGGMPGVSDTFAAALWAVDFLASLSKAGAAEKEAHRSARGASAWRRRRLGSRNRFFPRLQEQPCVK